MEKRKLFNKYISVMKKYLLPLKGKIFLLAIIMLISIILELINPQIIKIFIDDALSGAKMSKLIFLAILFIVLAIANQGFQILINNTGRYIGWTATNNLREDLLKHCLSLDVAYYKDKKPGELIDRVDGDVSVLLNFFSSLAITIINNFLVLVGIIILLFRENWLIGLAQLIFVIVAGYVLTKNQHIAIPYWKNFRKDITAFYGSIGEHIECREEFKINQSGNYSKKIFEKYIRPIKDSQMKAYIKGSNLFLLTLFFLGLSSAISLGLGVYLWSKGKVSVGAIFMFYQYTTYLMHPVDKIRTELQNLQRASASIDRVNDLFNLKSTLEDNGQDKIDTNNTEINIKDVDFYYDEETEIFNKLELTIEKGKTLAILGRTGSGKTTLARLISRQYDVIKGNVTIGNKNLKDIKLNNLRKEIAYVTQQIQVFSATLRDNITMFNEEIDDETILDVIEQLGIQEWYSKFENGLDTVLYSEGSNISAGEAQLITIIRVFLRNPSIIILDEISSKLDPITELCIENAIKSMIVGRIAIIITHKISTLNLATDILIMESGKIVEYGEKEILAEKTDSKFYDLIKEGLTEVLA